MDLIQLTCPSCNANLTVESGRDILFCQYCGTKIALVKEEDAESKERTKKEIKIAKVNARKEIMLANMEMQKKMMPLAMFSLVVTVPLLIVVLYFLYKMYLLTM